MANETLGGIAWVVDADTSGAVQSIGDLGNQANKAEKMLAGLDEAALQTATRTARLERITSNYSATLRKNGSTISSTGIVLDKFGRINETATERLSKLNSEMNKVKPVAAGVNQAISGMGRNAGQASIQLQQLIGQIQGGQDVMLALSQQSADLGFVLGAPLLGAVIGITASIAGMLLPQLFKTTNALEDIEKATERTRAAMTLSADGVANYSDEMQRLKSISEGLLKIKLAGLIAEQQQAMKMAADGMMDAIEQAGGFYGHIALFDKKTEDAAAATRRLFIAIRNFKTKPTEEGIKDLEAALTRATEAGINTTKKGNELSLTLVELITKFKEGEQTIEQFNAALSNTDEVAERSSSSIKKSIKETIDALKEQARTTNETARQTAIRRISETGQATKTDIWLINKQFDKLEAAEAKRQAEMEAKRKSRRTRQDPNEKYQQVADRLSVQAIKLQSESLALEKALTLEKAAREGVSDAIRKQISDSYDLRIANAKEAEAARAKAKAEQEAAQKKRDNDRLLAEKNRAREFAQGIVNKRFGESPEVIRVENEREKLKGLKDQLIEDEKLYQDALTQLAEDGANARMQANAMAMGSFSSSFDMLANVLRDAQGEQSTAYKAMFALSKGFAVAQAGLNLSLALSNALASGPFPWNLGAIATVASAGAGFISAIGSAAYGGREHGGSVMANQVYEVGEKNKPEMLMIPGNNGKVFSNSEVKSMMGGGGGGGGAPIINNYAAGAGYEVQYRRDEVTKRDVFDIVQSEMTNPNSKGRRGMQQNSNLHGVLNGGRRR